MTRVAPFAQQALILHQIATHRADMLDRQTRLASGKVAQTYAGLAPKARALLGHEAARDRSTQFIDNIDKVESRLKLSHDAITGIDRIGREMRKMLNTALDGPDAHRTGLAPFARNARTLIAGALNLRDGNRFLFGGNRFDNPPVDFSAPYRPPSVLKSDGVTVDRRFYDAHYETVQGQSLPYTAGSGSFYEQIYFDKNGVLPTGPLPADMNNPTVTEFGAGDPDLYQYYLDRMNGPEMLANPKTDYYRGGDAHNVVRASETVSLPYGARADAPAFQQLLTAVDAIASLPESAIGKPEGQAVIQKARDMLERVLGSHASDGFESLPELQARLNGPREAIRLTREAHVRFVTYAEALVSGAEDINREAIVSRLQSDQVQLRASYATLGRINALSLLDYIRN